MMATHADLVKLYEQDKLDICTLCKHKRKVRYCDGCDFYDQFVADEKRYARALAALSEARRGA